MKTLKEWAELDKLFMSEVNVKKLVYEVLPSMQGIYSLCFDGERYFVCVDGKEEKVSDELLLAFRCFVG